MKILIARYLSVVLKFLFSLRYGKRVVFGKRIILSPKFCFRGPGKLIIGDDVNLWTHNEMNGFFTFSPEAVITVGDKCRLNGVTIQCRKAVTIGEECLLGSVMLIDNDFHSVHFEKRNDSSAIKSAPIVIGRRVWLAGQSAVLKGVTIGDESVVGFRAVVTKDVPPKKIAAGNPAVVVKDTE